MRRITLAIIMILIAGCAVIAKRHLDEIYGPQSVVDRSIEAPALTASSNSVQQKVPEYYRDMCSLSWLLRCALPIKNDKL